MRLDHLLSKEQKRLKRVQKETGSLGNQPGKRRLFLLCLLCGFVGVRKDIYKRNLKGWRERGHGEGHGGVAQLGEHLLCKQGVSGSNPLISTIRRTWAHSSGG